MPRNAMRITSGLVAVPAKSMPGQRVGPHRQGSARVEAVDEAGELGDSPTGTRRRSPPRPAVRLTAMVLASPVIRPHSRCRRSRSRHPEMRERGALGAGRERAARHHRAAQRERAGRGRPRSRRRRARPWRRAAPDRAERDWRRPAAAPRRAAIRPVSPNTCTSIRRRRARASRERAAAARARARRRPPLEAVPRRQMPGFRELRDQRSRQRPRRRRSRRCCAKVTRSNG